VTRAATRKPRKARGTVDKVKRESRKANRGLKQAAANPWLERTARLGYVIRGLLYAAMGVLAMGVAIGASTDTTDQRGLAYLVGHNPFGGALLAVAIVGLAAYALWGFVRAIYDPLRRGDDAAGIVARLGFAWSAVNYLALMLFMIGVAIGTTRSSQSDSIQKTVQAVLAHPFGWIAVTLAGAVAIAGGLGQFVEAYKAGFKGDIKRNQMTRLERVTVDYLGRFGMVGRGVIFTIVGYLIFNAGIRRDASGVEGFGAAFRTLAGEPMGHLLLAIVALAFVALGLHSFANARWVRMPAASA